ncbi:RNA-binding protein 34-like isoform X2 [Penaeus chinensis]|nr:RNA-binding protein 34-like isoform X2 [Penaeus chinensis]
MGDASKNEKKTSKKVASSKKQQLNKGLYMKKLKKMLEADGAAVNQEANNESNVRNKKSPAFEKERNTKIQQTLEADGSFIPIQANKGIGNRNKSEKSWGKDSTKAENRKRANENQAVEKEGSKKFKPMLETDKRSSKSWKKNVVEEEEAHVKPHKTQSETEESQLKGDSVFVGNIDLKAKRKSIQKFFQTYGEVEGVRICSLDQAHPQDRKNMASFKKSLQFQLASQCAYVRFKSAESATAAVDANNKIFRGHSIVVFSSCGNHSVNGRASVFVGNVSVDADEDELEKIFQECGEIESVRIFRESNSDTERAIAYVNFETPKAIPQAIKKNNTRLRGHCLRVQRYSLRIQMEKNRKKISANKQKREERASLAKPQTNGKTLAGRDRRPSNYGNRPFTGVKFRTMGGDRKNFEGDRKKVSDTQMLTDVKPRKHIRFDEENNTSRGNMRPQSVDFQPMSHVTNMDKPKLHLKFDD